MTPVLHCMMFLLKVLSHLSVYIFLSLVSSQNTEAEIKEIWEMYQVTQDNQIKGECQLRDLVKSIEFYN